MNFSKNQVFLFFITLLSIIFSISCIAQQENVLKIGAERLVDEKVSEIYGKKIALIVNHTSVLSNGTHLLDTLLHFKEIKVQKLFAPEHGIRGDADAGKHINDSIDPVTGIKIFSLYGSTKKPTEEMLKDIDLMIFDIQDVGARYYTYISTLYYVLEAAAEFKKKIIVLDRPNPIGGSKVEGPILDKNFKSFVGITQIPIRHGMTIGELSLLFNDEILDKNNISADLLVIKMLNWEREKYFDDYSSKWLPPSPNINTFETALVYPGTCLIEGMNVSEGRGTYEPFLVIGAPFIKSDVLIKELNQMKIKGVIFEPAEFTPISIKGMSSSPKLKDKKCNGIRIKIQDKEQFNPVEFGIKLISVLIKKYAREINFNKDFFDKLAGTDKLREQLLDNADPELIISSWQNELTDFLTKRNNYLLY